MKVMGLLGHRSACAKGQPKAVADKAWITFLRCMASLVDPP
jgi:hypothetical protein